VGEGKLEGEAKDKLKTNQAKERESCSYTHVHVFFSATMAFKSLKVQPCFSTTEFLSLFLFSGGEFNTHKLYIYSSDMEGHPR
jgi:hypothetical protein